MCSCCDGNLNACLCLWAERVRHKKEGTARPSWRNWPSEVQLVLGTPIVVPIGPLGKRKSLCADPGCRLRHLRTGFCAFSGIVVLCSRNILSSPCGQRPQYVKAPHGGGLGD